MTIRIGITGHQRLADEAAWGWILERMREVAGHESAPVEAVSSLARGADQAFADVVLECGGTVYAVIPFPGYERTLTGPHLANYKRLLGCAESEVLPPHSDDESAYLAAGQRVVDLSARMIAVWDGAASRGKGGTADIVAYARARKRSVLWIDPVSRSAKEMS